MGMLNVVYLTAQEFADLPVKQANTFYVII